MTVNVNNKDNIGLLLIPEPKSIVPVSLSAFQVTQSSRNKLREYINALLIKPDGSISRITDIVPLGYWGASVGRKILSALTGARNINVHWESVHDLDLDQIKNLVADYLTIDSEQGDPFLPQNRPIVEVTQRVLAATSIPEIFEVIFIPPEDECLDVL